MSKETVWVSTAMMDTTLTKQFDADLYLADQDTAVDAMRRNKRGEPLPAERFPKEIYARHLDQRHKKQPDIFYVGFWIVSAAFADVLRRFDLGKTSLYPTSLFQFDRKTPVDGTYLCLNFGETKDTFLPEESPRAGHSRYEKPPTSWTPALTAKDGDLALSEEALAGVDLWIEEKMRDAFFLSDRLVQALRGAKLTRRLGLSKTRLICED